MRILLVGNYPLDYQPSMVRYAELLRAGMAERGHEVQLLLPRAYVARLHEGGLLGKWLGYIDKYLIFPWVLRRKSRAFELVHVCDHSNSVYLPHAAGKAKSITCHDLLAVYAAEGRYPERRITAAGRILQWWIRRYLKTAPCVVCVSTFTADEFVRLGARQDQERTVILNPLNYDYTPAEPEAVAAMRRELGLGAQEKYLLHVGGDAWYKNRKGVVQIYRLLADQLKSEGKPAPRIVFAGRNLRDDLRAYIAEHNLVELVVECVRPSNEELRRLYTGATALLFPSLYEGFGWPPLEAQSCGCPVITSNRPPMTEVAGEGALLIDPEDEVGAARAIVKALDELPRLRDAGFENLKRFDRGQILDSYEKFFISAANSATQVRRC
jgi:glycosyltransferase involved in cell wall biosynthesis